MSGRAFRGGRRRVRIALELLAILALVNSVPAESSTNAPLAMSAVVSYSCCDTAIVTPLVSYLFCEQADTLSYASHNSAMVSYLYQTSSVVVQPGEDYVNDGRTDRSAEVYGRHEYLMGH